MQPEPSAQGTLPKIALFIADMGCGGAERVFINLAKAFSERGYPVDLVAGTLRGAANMDGISPKVRLVDLDMSRMALGGPKLIRYLRREKPAVMLASRDHSCCLAVLAGKLAGVETRVAVNAVNMIAPELLMLKPVKRRIFKSFVRYCFPRADRVIAVSRGVAQELRDDYGVPEEKLRVVYTPIITGDLLKMAAEPVDHEWFREGQPPVVLTLGGLKPVKRQETLIRAFARVRQRMVARLVILGEGQRRAELEALVADLGLGEDVSLPGFQENPFRFIARARLFVLSSISEGLPSVLIEALACGCPVVSTDCPSGPREILQDGRLGRLVPVGDEVAMAEAILASLAGDRHPPCGAEDLRPFTVDYSAQEHLRVLFGERLAT